MMFSNHVLHFDPSPLN